MSDPITGAIAGSVASTAIKKVVNYIEESENPEEAWRRSAAEVAIQVESYYRQELIAGHTYNPDEFEVQVNEYGELLQQLSIRGEVRDFDDEFVSFLNEFANDLGDFADTPIGLGEDPEEYWEEMVEDHIERIKQSVDI